MRLLNIDDIGNRQRDLDAVSIVVAAENDTLDALHPFLGTRAAVGAEVVCAMPGNHVEVGAILVLVRYASRDTVR